MAGAVRRVRLLVAAPPAWAVCPSTARICSKRTSTWLPGASAALAGTPSESAAGLEAASPPRRRTRRSMRSPWHPAHPHGAALTTGCTGTISSTASTALGLVVVRRVQLHRPRPRPAVRPRRFPRPRMPPAGRLVGGASAGDGARDPRTAPPPSGRLGGPDRTLPVRSSWAPPRSKMAPGSAPPDGAGPLAGRQKPIGVGLSRQWRRGSPASQWRRVRQRGLPRRLRGVASRSGCGFATGLAAGSPRRAS